jgi:hypothetical protein
VSSERWWPPQPSSLWHSCSSHTAGVFDGVLRSARQRIPILASEPSSCCHCLLPLSAATTNKHNLIPPCRYLNSSVFSLAFDRFVSAPDDRRVLQVCVTLVTTGPAWCCWRVRDSHRMRILHMPMCACQSHSALAAPLPWHCVLLQMVMALTTAVSSAVGSGLAFMWVRIQLP